MSEISRIQVLITTLVEPGVYGGAIDITEDVNISDYVFENGIKKIKVKTDDSDFDIGFFNFSDLNLRVSNVSGKFNPHTDYRSLFVFSRDQAKVDVSYFDTDGNKIAVFKGLVNDEDTRQDFLKEEVRLRILSQDSIFRKVKVTGGTVKDGQLFSEAFASILNKPAITSVLNFDVSKIEVDLDLTIDRAEVFDEKTTRNALDLLLQASNSVFIIDGTNTMVVRTRRVNSNDPHPLSNGGTDIQEAENIIAIKNYNTGVHRVFNSTIINDRTEVSDPLYVNEFGLQQKEFTFDFITDIEKEEQIAEQIVLNFKVPKIEMEILTDIDIAKDFRLFDQISVDFEKRRKRFKGNRMPHYDIAKYDEDVYPYAIGSFTIEKNRGFKIIGLSYDLKNYTMMLKLRELGIARGDSINFPNTRITTDGDIRITADGDIRVVTN